MLLDGLFQLNSKDVLTNVFDLKQRFENNAAASTVITTTILGPAARDRCLLIVSVGVRAQGGAAQRPLNWTLDVRDGPNNEPGFGEDFDRASVVAVPQSSSWQGQFVILPEQSFSVTTVFDAAVAINLARVCIQWFDAPRGQMAFSSSRIVTP